MNLHVSVVVATYNGEMWLEEQLESIRRQTRPPDQVVISDDGSSDRTIDIIQAFASGAPFEVKIIRRNRPLGFSQNFSVAAGLASGNIVFFCDQDDVWFDNKIAVVLASFRQDGTALVAHDLVVVDQHLAEQPVSMLSRLSAAGVDSVLHQKGCATAVHRSLLSCALPVPGNFAFDTWLHEVARAADVRRVIPTILMAYRVHGQNTSTFFLNQLGPPGTLGPLRRAILNARGRASWRLAKTDRLVELQGQLESVVDAARAYISYQTDVSKFETARLQELKLRISELERRIRWRQKSRLWRVLSSIRGNHTTAARDPERY